MDKLREASVENLQVRRLYGSAAAFILLVPTVILGARIWNDSANTIPPTSTAAEATTGVSDNTTDLGEFLFVGGLDAFAASIAIGASAELRRRRENDIQ